MIDHLQGGTKRIGMGPGELVLAVQIEHKPSDRHSGIAAIVHQLQRISRARIRGQHHGCNRHLAGLLGFEPAPIEPTLPVLLFCALFGLSMDYEVLLLSRMQEEYRRTGDNTHAVAEGLERSGRLITSAAAIMVSVFTAFALARVVLIKAMGLGMAIAVALDATLVRVLIVPSTMRLLGELNWWAPRPLRKLCERLGLSPPR